MTPEDPTNQWPAYRDRCKELPADASDDLWVRDELGGALTVMSAPMSTIVDDDFYQAVLDGRCHPDVSAGEGVFVIHAINGTFRYVLDELEPINRTWTAHRI